MHVGVVDLDTSHPENWIPIIRDLGHEVAGIFNHGDVYPAAYVQEFAGKLGVPKVFASLEEMAESVDCAIVHSCDWDRHVERARPFIAAGKGVLLDKPMGGNLADLNQILDWARAGARISGGSSFRFCDEARAYLAQPVTERETPHTVFAGMAVDDFNYGIHAYSLLASVMGAGALSVRHLGKGVQRRLEVLYGDGRVGLLSIGAQEAWLPGYLTIVTDREVTQIVTDTKALYRALLQTVLPYLGGQDDQPPLPMQELIEPELVALAARQSWLNDDRPVKLSGLDVRQAGYDGEEFRAEYQRKRLAALK